MQGRLRLFLILIVASATALAVVSPAGAQDPGVPVEPEPEPEPTKAKASIHLRVKGLDGRNVRVNRRAVAHATIRPFVPGQKLKIGVYRRGKTVKQARKTIRRKKGKNAGTVKLSSPRFVKPGKHAFRAVHEKTPEQAGAKDSSRRFAVKYPNLGLRSSGGNVKLFHKLLAREGYRNAPRGKHANAATGRAVHAFRKTNGMRRSQNPTAGIFKKLAAGKGAFKLRYPNRGHHVEIDISRQVMVLADNGKPKLTYHVSTGAPGTPSDRGHFRFYRKDPGFNSIGMYYSVYYNRGEATHGYKSVPNYPASHGCIRNPIPDSVSIYNWINLGDSIWVYA